MRHSYSTSPEHEYKADDIKPFQFDIIRIEPKTEIDPYYLVGNLRFKGER